MSVTDLTGLEDTYEADLAKAIEASLRDAPVAGGASYNPAWDALLAAGQTAAADYVAMQPAAAAAAAGRASPVLMLPAPPPPPPLGGALASRLADVEEEDADFQRQLAAAMAASMQTAEEDSHRRKYGLPTAAAAAAAPATALPSIFPGMGPSLGFGVGMGAGHVYSAAAPQVPAGNSSVFAAWATGAAAAASGPMVAPPGAAVTEAAAALCPGAGLQCNATRQLSAPLPGLEQGLADALRAGAPPGSPASSTAASAGGSGPSTPMLGPSPLAPHRAAATQPARHAAAAIPPRPAVAAAAAAAASLLLSASPGKHGRTPSHASVPEATQPHMKRSRPASDSGAGAAVSAFGAGAGLQATAESLGAGQRASTGPGISRATSSGLSGHLAARRLGGGGGDGDVVDSCSGASGGVRGTWTDLRGRCASVVTAADLAAGAHGESPPTRPASAASGCNPAALAEASAAVSLAAAAASASAAAGERQGQGQGVIAPLDLTVADLSSSRGPLAPLSLMYPNQAQHLLSHQQQHHHHHQAQQRLDRSGSVADGGGSGLRGAVAALDLSRPAAPLEQLLAHAQAQAEQHPHPQQRRLAEACVPMRRAASLATYQQATAALAVEEPMAVDAPGSQPQPLPLPLPAPPTSNDGGASAYAADDVPAFDGAGDRRLLQHQRVWWWLGPSQAQLGRVVSIDRRSSPLLYSVRLDSPAGGGGGGGLGEVVIATADCLLPFITFGEEVMCRLEVDASGDTMQSGNALGEEGGAQQAGAAAGQEASAPPAAAAAASQARPCAWARGVLQHCVFDGPVPAVHVLLQQPYGAPPLPCTVPYAAVVPCLDAAEGSGSNRGGADGVVGGGAGGGGAWDMVASAFDVPRVVPGPWAQQGPVNGVAFAS
ncbi:hypothetical protein HYH02_002515 [Chlamydomonas schloesseri]|uniref:Uncharacterized protein n=1 Tax=Chlamydomonas schloesseri TaxID=2026947 RepID=A0A835WT78_9CHLO|nr:hypothetical protein HYH02_002515 [Chlamydomonas schloesseri]|eukprot:KAG2453191.1 hypothetical protein HYH02_002515 [Chlamydomonas schloesseri]